MIIHSLFFDGYVHRFNVHIVITVSILQDASLMDYVNIGTVHAAISEYPVHMFKHDLDYILFHSIALTISLATLSSPEKQV